jgi:hypothetical protein
MASSLLIAASAAIVLLLGSVHLFYTFASDRFQPRERDVEERMRAVSPVLTRQTTMWKAWVGFNASHSLGAILFGLVYGYLAVWHPTFLFGSPFLLALGGSALLGYLVLAKLYWFRVPLRGIALSFVLYLVGVIVGLR